MKTTCLLKICIVVITLTGCVQNDPGRTDPDVTVSEVTDLGIVDQGPALYDRDGGYSGIVGDKNVWVFGDTVLNEPNSNGDTWLSNSWSFGYDMAATDGISGLTMGHDDSGTPTELLTYTIEEENYNRLHTGENCEDPCGGRWALWPGPVVHDPDNQRSLVFFAKIQAEPGEFNFYSVGQSVAVWEENAQRPVRLTIDESAEYPTLMFDAHSPSFGHAALLHDGYLFAYACNRKGDVKPCKLAKVVADKVHDRAAWQFYAGDDEWSDKTDDARVLFYGNDILSVHWNNYLQRFIAIYNKPQSRDIMLRSAPSPKGPWTRETRFARALPTSNGNGWVYDALAHPEFSENAERHIYITYTYETTLWKRDMRLLTITVNPKQE